MRRAELDDLVGRPEAARHRGRVGRVVAADRPVADARAQ